MLTWTADAETKAAPEYDRRGYDRIPICWSVHVSDQTCAGAQRVLRGRALDMSSSGTLIETRQRLEVGSYVRLRGNELLMGAAQVRHRSRRGFKFRIGLEFVTAIEDRF